MSEPPTFTGRQLAAFLRGLLPETRQFDAQIADIEQEAVDAFVRDELPRLLAEALRLDANAVFPELDRKYEWYTTPQKLAMALAATIVRLVSDAAVPVSVPVLGADSPGSERDNG